MRITPEGNYFLPQFHQTQPCIPTTAFPTAALKARHFQRTSHVKNSQLYAPLFIACERIFSPVFPEVSLKHLVSAVTSDLP